MATELTWLGHASFRVDTPGGKRIYVDPWLNGNPKCPESELEPERCDLILLTHGHGDHVGDTVAIHERFGCSVVALLELRGWLEGKGVEANAAHGPNKGGTVGWEGVKATLTDANHSSSTPDGAYAGEPTGIVLEVEDGFKIYFAGDTNVSATCPSSAASIHPTSPCFRSETTTRWDHVKQPSRSSYSASSASSRAITGRSGS